MSTLPATLPGGENIRHWQAVQTGHRPRLWWAFHRVTLLPVSTHRWLRGIRLGLDNCSQALQGQLLLRWMCAEVSPQSHRQQGQPSGQCRPLLHAHQDVTHKHAVFQWPWADNLRKNPFNGCGPLWLLLSFLSSYDSKPSLLWTRWEVKITFTLSLTK